MRHTHVTGLLLVAHGSSDPRAGATTRALARAVGRLSPSSLVRVAFLDHAGPRVGEALRDMPRPVAVVPLLLTNAYHARVDLPAALAGTGAAMTDVLGPVAGDVPELLLAGLHRRLAGARFDALVLAAAGTREPAALSTVEQVAAALGVRLGVPCGTAYASAAVPRPDEAVAALRAAGARRVAVASYFLATGRLYPAAAESAIAAGAVAVAEPLGDAPEIARLVLDRAAAVAAASEAPAPPAAVATAPAASEAPVASEVPVRSWKEVAATAA
jgi:sirohydrochlorin ferrochelatase